MKTKISQTLTLLALIGVNTPLMAESLNEAMLRSGSVVAKHNIPSVLIEGNSYKLRWITQSYVPIDSWLQLTLPDGTKKVIEATLDKSEKGSYSISGQNSMNFYFEADYTVPDDTVGKTRIGFYHAQDDGETPFKMFGLLATGSVERPYGTAGKNFYTNICSQNSVGGQCVAYVRNYFGGSYSTMPGLCVHDDCGAHHAYDDWDLGYGKGIIPKINSIMVMDDGGGLPVGHVAVVVGVEDNKDGTWKLVTQESNWDLDEKIDCGSIYSFNADTQQVTRGNKSYSVRGFIYSGTI